MRKLIVAGEPVTASAQMVPAPKGVDMRLAGTLVFPGGVLAQLDCAFDLPDRQGLEVVGSGGSLRVAMPWAIEKPGIELRRGNEVERIEVERADRYRLQTDNFSRAVRGLEPPLLGREDALGQARKTVAGIGMGDFEAAGREIAAGGRPGQPGADPRAELEIGRLGFGAMRIVTDREEGVRVVRRAVELGVTLIDTADVYGAGVSEEVVAEALHPYPEGIVIATKGGLGHGLQERVRDGRPEHLREACDASLRRLRLERIDLYQLHRHDPEVPVEESIGALEALRQEGKIRLIGVSNFSLGQLRRAQSVTRIVSVQNQYSRGLLTSDDVLDACEAEGIGFMPWSPLGEGLRSPAEELRWLLDRSPVMLPIPGTSSVEHLEENMRALGA